MFRCLADENETYRWGRIALCLVLLVITVLLITACGGPSAEEVTADAERVAHDKKITYRLPDGRIFEATYPLEYTATASQCSAKDGCKTRHYFPRGQK